MLLPDEVWLQILKYCSFESQINLTSTCLQLYKLRPDLNIAYRLFLSYYDQYHLVNYAPNYTNYNHYVIKHTDECRLYNNYSYYYKLDNQDLYAKEFYDYYNNLPVFDFSSIKHVERIKIISYTTYNDGVRYNKLFYNSDIVKQLTSNPNLKTINFPNMIYLNNELFSKCNCSKILTYKALQQYNVTYNVNKLVFTRCYNCNQLKFKYIEQV